MGDMIVTRLRDLGRYDWFEESCAAARQKRRDLTSRRMAAI